jgi:2-phosphoglycolate phosphatase|tara:strand:+ start:438 stop:1142 length:705 start_codon:yes stop_codon:yes gene_type:complete
MPDHQIETPLETSIECVLFDLDGTLVDTAQDFVSVVNKLLSEYQKAPLAADLIRQTVSNGARALVTLAFEIDENHENFADLNQRLLDLYYEELAETKAVLYPGMERLLSRIEQVDIKWGIVTNKPEKYTRKLLQKLNLLERCQSLVCPDHVTHSKPHPEPILLACEQLNVGTERVVYLGDHIRDIQAAKNADVIAIAAAYGYLAKDAKAEDWYADFVIRESDQVESLLTLLKFA